MAPARLKQSSTARRPADPHRSPRATATAIKRELAGSRLADYTAAGTRARGRRSCLCPASRQRLRQHRPPSPDAPWPRGFPRTGVRVESVNLRISPARQLLETIRRCDALLIGSPPWAAMPPPDRFGPGHLLAEADRAKPVSVRQLRLERRGGSTAGSEIARRRLPLRLRDPSGEVQPRRRHASQRLEETGRPPGEGTAGSAAPQHNGSPPWPHQSVQQHRGAGLGRIVRLASACSPPAAAKARRCGKVPWLASWVSQASLHPTRASTVAVAKDRAVETCCMLGEGLHALNVLAEGRQWAR